MGENLCRLADAQCLKLNDRILEVSLDRGTRKYVGPSEHYYERKARKNLNCASSTTSTKLFLKNVPLCSVSDLVKYLEQEHGVHILRASVQPTQ